jgi:hypothetical protein
MTRAPSLAPGARWAIDAKGPASRLLRDKTPVARFYTGKLSLPECFDVARRLNATERN